MISSTDLQIMKWHRLNKAFSLTDRSLGNKLPAFFFFLFSFRLVAHFAPFMFLLVAVVSAHLCSALVPPHLCLRTIRLWEHLPARPVLRN